MTDNLERRDLVDKADAWDAIAAKNAEITRLQEALAAAEARETAKDKQIAELTAALRNVRGYMADVAVAGMLIGADQAETHTRVSAHGIAMLKIVDAALSSRLPNKEDRNG